MEFRRLYILRSSVGEEANKGDREKDFERQENSRE